MITDHVDSRIPAFRRLKWAKILLVLACALTVRLSALPTTTSLSINLNSQEIEVQYPLGQDPDRLAGQILDQLGIQSGLGCDSRECLVDRLANRLRRREPHTLSDWLLQNGWSQDQVGVFNDVLNINFWHFAMLNDGDRNQKFDSAIRRAVSRVGPKARVIDLGSGSGLLAMMAARSGASAVYAIEKSSLLSSLAPRILENNGFRLNETIHWFQKNSLEVKIDDVGGHECDILVSETLGVSVLDEAGLLYMSDLRDRLIRPQLGNGDKIVIPARVVTYAAVIRCDALMRLSWVDQAAGFDVSPLNAFRHEKVNLRRMSKDWGFMLSEADHEVVAGPFELLDIDFVHDDPHQYDGGRNISKILPVLSDGEVHAVVTWFEAFLDQEDPSNKVSTSPWAEDNTFSRQQHWGQLIELLPTEQSEDGSRIIPIAKRGGSIRMTAHISSAGGAGSIYFPNVEILP